MLAGLHRLYDHLLGILKKGSGRPARMGDRTQQFAWYRLTAEPFAGLCDAVTIAGVAEGAAHCSCLIR